MNEKDEIVQPGRDEEKPADASGAQQKSARGPKFWWFVGTGAVLLLIAAAVLIYFAITIFGSKDPIAAVVPKDSLLYMTVDLTQTQSDNFNDIYAVFQEMADVDKQQPLVDSLNEQMSEELGMSFTDDVMSWIGPHAGLVLTGADFADQDFDFTLIVQARSQGKADEFIAKFIAALEDRQDMKFESSEKDGLTLYVDSSSAQSTQDAVIARGGRFVYLSNSEEAVLKSAALKKSDSLADSQEYKDATAALKQDRMATIYLSGDGYLKSLSSMMSDLSSGTATSVQDMGISGLKGIAMGLSIEEVGLRLDTIATYDVAELSEYQKETLNAVYAAPETDAFVPEDTVLYIAQNSSLDAGSFLKEGNPMYDKDVQETFEIFENQYGVSMVRLFELLDGEIALAVGPASDGLFSELGMADVGLTLIAGTEDEKGFNKWFNDLLAVGSELAAIEFNTSKASFGDYSLQKLTIKDLGTDSAILVYGADNGYMFLGSSSDMLKGGLVGDGTLAKSAGYIETWKAFPAGSVPYLYMDMPGLMDLIVDSMGTASTTELDAMRAGVKKMPVIAAAMNNTPGYDSSTTTIIFIDTGK